jgi:lipopolysaccharide transport system ATP-binding protein
VGTGFHPELTGRENIFLNGAVMGMKRAEIRQKFDEIVAFAEVEKFLDTPVKRFSSGMYVRLAFSVAAHLEPEILLVDEVLAVGDSEFQKKCLGKMGTIADEGRTILFVSHNMGAIKRLCKRTVVIDKGNIVLDDDSDVAINTYLSRFSQAEDEPFFKSGGREKIRNGFVDIFFKNEIGRTDTVLSGSTLEIHLKYKVEEENRMFHWGIGIYDEIGNSLLHFGSMYSRKDSGPMPANGRVVCKIPRFPLPEGRYSLNFSMHKDGVYLEHLVGAVYLYVGKGDFFGTGRIPTAATAKVLLDHSWEIKEENETG